MSDKYYNLLLIIRLLVNKNGFTGLEGLYNKTLKYLISLKQDQDAFAKTKVGFFNKNITIKYG